MEFVVEVYKFTADFPNEEKFGLTSQLRRAAVLIPTNVSEGSTRKSTKECIQFLYVSLGSSSELEALLEICIRLNIGLAEKASDLLNQLEKIKRMLISLIKTLKKKST